MVTITIAIAIIIAIAIKPTEKQCVRSEECDIA